MSIDENKIEKLDLAAKALALREMEDEACGRGYNKGLLLGFTLSIIVSLIVGILWYGFMVPDLSGWG